MSHSFVSSSTPYFPESRFDQQSGVPKQSGMMTDRERAICRRLKQFREQIRWPQSAFAHELGISRDKLASIEYERSPLSYAIGYRVCAMFDVSAEWLSTGQGAATPSDGMSARIPPGNLPARVRFSEAMDSQPAGSSVADAQNRKALSDPINKWQSGDEDFVERWLKRAVEVVSASRFSTESERQEFARRCEHLLTSLTLSQQRKRVSQSVRVTAAAESSIDPAFPNYSKKTKVDAVSELELNTALGEVETWLSLMREEMDAGKGANPPADVAQYRREFKAAAAKLSALLDGKSGVDKLRENVNLEGVTKSTKQPLPTWEEVVERAKRATSKPGSKGALAQKLGIAPARLSEWLNLRVEPGAVVAFKLLHEVEELEKPNNNKAASAKTHAAESTSKGTDNAIHTSKPRESSQGTVRKSTSQRRK